MVDEELRFVNGGENFYTSLKTWVLALLILLNGVGR